MLNCAYNVIKQCLCEKYIILLRRNGFLLRFTMVIKCKYLMTLNLGFITRETMKDYNIIAVYIIYGNTMDTLARIITC